MYACGLNKYVQPFVNNLAGWTKGVPQWCPYLTTWSFDNDMMRMCAVLTKGKYGDLLWDYSYMTEALTKCAEMKPIWDKAQTTKLRKEEHCFMSLCDSPKTS